MVNSRRIVEEMNVMVRILITNQMLMNEDPAFVRLILMSCS